MTDKHVVSNDHVEPIEPRSGEKKTRVYLDNCAYNRPYDDQSQAKIELETQAKLKIQRLITDKQIELASSYMSLYECGENPNQDTAALITDYINSHSSVHVGIARKDEIEKTAEEVMETGVKFKDACHIASAIFASADYFISTDSRLLKYQTDKIKLINPVDYFIDEAVDQ